MPTTAVFGGDQAVTHDGLHEPPTETIRDLLHWFGVVTCDLGGLDRLAATLDLDVASGLPGRDGRGRPAVEDGWRSTHVTAQVPVQAARGTHASIVGWFDVVMARTDQRPTTSSGC